MVAQKSPECDYCVCVSGGGVGVSVCRMGPLLGAIGIQIQLLYLLLHLVNLFSLC